MTLHTCKNYWQILVLVFCEEVALWLVLSFNLPKHQTKDLIVIVLLHVSVMQKCQFDAKSHQIGIPKYINCQFGKHLCHPNWTEAACVDLTKENCHKTFCTLQFFCVGSFLFTIWQSLLCPGYCVFCAQFANLGT